MLADWGICGRMEGNLGTTQASTPAGEESQSTQQVSTGIGVSETAGSVDPGAGTSGTEETPRPVAFIQGAPMGTPFWAAPELDVGAPHDQ